MNKTWFFNKEKENISSILIKNYIHKYFFFFYLEKITITFMSLKVVPITNLKFEIWN